MVRLRVSDGDGGQKGVDLLPSDYLLVRREALLIELGWLEEELLRRRLIKRGRLLPARRR